jgi:hypothetical protein
MPDAEAYPGRGETWTPPDARSVTPKRPRRGWLIALTIVMVVFGAGFGACAYIASQVGNINIGSPPLQPIPVSHHSCPYLRQVHDAAVVAGSASGAAMNESSPRIWHVRSRTVGWDLLLFDLSLRRAALHTPARIAAKLREVHGQVMIGLRALRNARTGSAWSNSTFDAVTSGYFSLSDASELTGNACGFTVAPDMSVFVNPAAGS